MGEVFSGSDSDGFDTTLILFRPSALIYFNTEHWITRKHQKFIPLDQYWFVTFAFAIESATNKSIPIVMFAIGDGIYGPVDFTTTYDEVAARNNFTYNTEGGPVTVEVESRAVLAKIRRSVGARTLTFSMFAINWVLTLGSVAIAVVALLRRGEVNDGVAFLPITIILSIPTIRSLYVGSPPYGTPLGMHQNCSAILSRIDTVLY